MMRAGERVIGRRTRGWPIVLAGLIALGGCATPAQMEQMVPDQFEASAAHEDSPLHRAVVIERVGGGEAPDPMMVIPTVGGEALEGTLRKALEKFGYLSSSESEAPFRLQAVLLDMRRPGVGITKIVTSLIRYKLIRVSDGSVVYDDVVTASAAKTGKDAFVGAERHRMAVEASIRANIAEFLANLRSPNLETKAR